MQNQISIFSSLKSLGKALSLAALTFLILSTFIIPTTTTLAEYTEYCHDGDCIDEDGKRVNGDTSRGYCSEGESIDCHGVCGGPSEFDECGDCDGPGKNEWGCCWDLRDIGCGCGIELDSNGCCPDNPWLGCGCGLAYEADGCCPGYPRGGCDNECGSTKVNVGCGCGVDKVGGCCPGQTNVGCGCGTAKIDGCCPSNPRGGCDNQCGSTKVDVGCGCGVAKVNGCCPNEANVGCGCGIAKVNGCCPGQVKGCDGVCNSGKTNVGCGCGVAKAGGCCPGQTMGCDGVCGSGKTNRGCGCGKPAPGPCGCSACPPPTPTPTPLPVSTPVPTPTPSPWGNWDPSCNVSWSDMDTAGDLSHCPCNLMALGWTGMMGAKDYDVGGGLTVHGVLRGDKVVTGGFDHCIYTICGQSVPCDDTPTADDVTCPRGNNWDSFSTYNFGCGCGNDAPGCDGQCSSPRKEDTGCGCGVKRDSNGCCPGNPSTGCGCGVSKVNGCCPGEANEGCGCGIRKVGGCCPSQVNEGCGCGVSKVNGCCPGQTNVGCGCGVSKVNGCCPGSVNAGCGCNVSLVNGCCPGQANEGCGCGVSRVNGCCPDQPRGGCDNQCGSTRFDEGCGCGYFCPKCAWAATWANYSGEQFEGLWNPPADDITLKAVSDKYKAQFAREVTPPSCFQERFNCAKETTTGAVFIGAICANVYDSTLAEFLGTDNYGVIDAKFVDDENGLSGYRTWLMDENCKAVPNDGSVQLCGFAGVSFSPISLLWNGREELGGLSKVVKFSLSTDPALPYSVWRAHGEAPLLVFDPRNTNTVTSARQLFGNATYGGFSLSAAHYQEGRKVEAPWEHGYQALSLLDSDKSGAIEGDELDSLRLWFDYNRDAKVDKGEFNTLSEMSVTKLYYKTPSKDEGTGDLSMKVGYERTINGKVVKGGSVDWFGASFASKRQAHDAMNTLRSAEFDDFDKKVDRQLESSPSSDAEGEPVNFASSKDASKDISGKWLWFFSEDDSGYRHPAAFILDEKSDGRVEGFDVVEAIFADNKPKGFRSQIRMLPMNGLVSSGAGGKKFEFVVRDEFGDIAARSTARVSADGMMMKGSTAQKAALRDGDKLATVDVDYFWEAYKLPKK